MAEPNSEWRREAPALFLARVDEVLSSYDLQKSLFESDRERDPLRSSRFGLLFSRVNEILVDHWFLSVARLHDDASSAHQWNLTLAFFTEDPHLDLVTKDRLTSLKTRMDVFAELVRKARNKLLAHNDYDHIVSATELGSFPPGKDVEYMAELKEFAEIVNEFFFGKPFIYDDLISNDVDALVSVVRLGLGVVEGEIDPPPGSADSD